MLKFDTVVAIAVVAAVLVGLFLMLLLLLLLLLLSSSLPSWWLLIVVDYGVAGTGGYRGRPALLLCHCFQGAWSVRLYSIRSADL